MFLGCMATSPWWLTACGGGNDGAIRLVQASPAVGSLDWWVEGSVKASGIAFGQSSGYRDIDSGGTEMSVSLAGSTSLLLTADVSVEARGHHQSWVVFGTASALKALMIDDEVTTPSSSYTTIKVLHTATQAPDVDVYLMNAADDPAGATLQSGSPALNTLEATDDVKSGLKRLRVTTAGQADDVLLDIPQMVCAGGGVTTLVLTDGLGGMLIEAIQLDQQGAVTPLVNPAARLRVVTALNGSAAVTVSAQGVALLSQATSPSIKDYTSVSAGTLTLAATIDGTAVAVPSLTLAKGGDHTLLITGTTAADAQFTLLTDDNSIPSPSTSASVRLVHAVTSLASTAVSLQVDFASIVTNLVFAAASTPVVLTPRTTANVRVIGGGQTLLQLTDQVFAAGAVYTVFVFNDGAGTGVTTGVLTQDR